MSKIRSNKLIWKIAEWLYSEFDENSPYTHFNSAHSSTSQLRYLRENYYDSAVELLKKIQNFEFTGGDEHDD